MQVKVGDPLLLRLICLFIHYYASWPWSSFPACDWLSWIPSPQDSRCPIRLIFIWLGLFFIFYCWTNVCIILEFLVGVLIISYPERHKSLISAVNFNSRKYYTRFPRHLSACPCVQFVLKVLHIVVVVAVVFFLMHDFSSYYYLKLV